MTQNTKFGLAQLEALSTGVMQRQTPWNKVSSEFGAVTFSKVCALLWEHTH